MSRNHPHLSIDFDSFYKTNAARYISVIKSYSILTQAKMDNICVDLVEYIKVNEQDPKTISCLFSLFQNTALPEYRWNSVDLNVLETLNSDINWSMDVSQDTKRYMKR